MGKKLETDNARTVRLAKLLLDVLDEHVRDAIDQNVPREVYVRAVADHAAHVYDSQKKAS